jgi:flagellar motor switch protein FliN/FliY
MDMGVGVSELMRADDHDEKNPRKSSDDLEQDEQASASAPQPENVVASEKSAQAEIAKNLQNPIKSETPDHARGSEDVDLELLLDIPLTIEVELGRTKIAIQELLKLGPGSAIKLTKLEGDPVDIRANDTLIARGQVVVQNEKYGIRVTEIASRMDRIRSFGA